MTDLIEQAQENYATANKYWSTQYEQSKKDWSFLHGEGQWSDDEKRERELDGSPCLVLNQLLPYAHQVTNDIKQARFSVRMTPVDSEGDVETAEVRAGVIRNIEKQSKSKDVYGTAGMYAVGSGIGWITVSTDYCHEKTFEQEARINRVVDFTSILADPLSEEVDGSDYEYGFEKIIYSDDKFKELYPDSDCVSFDSDGAPSESVLVVKYYWKEYTNDTIYQIKLSDGETKVVNSEEKGLIDDHNQSVYDGELDDIPVDYELMIDRKVDIPTVYVAVLSGADILEEKEEFPSQYIPIVPVIGEEVFIDDTREFRSLIRPAKDGQRMYNYWNSYSTETVALQPKTPWVGYEGSFDGDAGNWADANRKNIPYLESTPVYDENNNLLPPPLRQPQVQGSPFMVQQAMSSREDIRLSLGVSSANMGETGNLISGVALRTNQIEGDNATFHFSDNLSSSISQVGRILNDIITLVYSDRKIARIIGEDDKERTVPINQPYVKEGEDYRVARPNEQGQGVYRFDVGKYDVVSDVGASYSSKRQETADKLTEIAIARPEILDVAGDILFDVLDIPEGDRIADRLRSKLDPAILGDDPQAKQLQAAAQAMKQMEEQLNNALAALDDKQKNEKFEQTLKAEEAQLDRDKFRVESAKVKADIDKIYAQISKDGAESSAQSIENINAILDRVGGLEEVINHVLDDIEDDLETPEPEQTGQAIESELNE